MITSEFQFKTFTHILIDISELFPYGRPYRFQGFVSCAFLTGVPCQKLIIEMVYDTKEPAPALIFHIKLLAVRSPKQVGGILDNGTLVRVLTAACCIMSVWTQKFIVSHDLQHSGAACSLTGTFQPMPYLGATFANKMAVVYSLAYC